MRPKYIITPGGFTRVREPVRWDAPTGWRSRREDFGRLTAFAEPTVRRIMSKRNRERAVRIGARLITIGIDVFGRNDDKHPLAELIAAYDLDTETVLRWTGKSYPTASQERTLFQVTDLRSHILSHDRWRILLLGCHDLNMFSPRSAANRRPGSDRSKRCEAMERVVRRFCPRIVLHHPHATDSPNIWFQGWIGMQRLGVREWASGVARYNEDGGECRAGMDDILRATRSSKTDVADIVIPRR